MEGSPRQVLLNRAKRDIPLLALVTGIILLVISKLKAFEDLINPGASELRESLQVDLLAFLLSLIPAIFALFLWRRWHELIAELVYRSEVEEQLSDLVLHDERTSLSSRRLLMEHIEQALKTARRHHFGLSVFAIEIAGFDEIKKFNGGENAEHLLSVMGDQITAELRDADIVARLDDEHLGVLLPVVDGIEGAVIAAGRVQAALNRPLDLGETKVMVRVHIGLAYFPGGGEDAATLLEHAVSTARLAHYANADQVCYSPPQRPQPAATLVSPNDSSHRSSPGETPNHT